MTCFLLQRYSAVFLLALAVSTASCSAKNVISGSFPAGELKAVTLRFSNNSTSLSKVTNGATPYFLTLRNENGRDLYGLSASVVSGTATFTGGSFPGKNGNCGSKLFAASDCLLEIEYKGDAGIHYFQIEVSAVFDRIFSKTTALFSLDLSSSYLLSDFGNNGVVSLGVPGLMSANVSSIVVANDGIIIGGYSKKISGSNGEDITLAKVDFNGTPVSTFGIDGLSMVHFGDYDRLEDLDIDLNGKIIAGGRNIGGDFNCRAWRFNSDGSADTTFHNDGEASGSLGGTNDKCSRVASHASGRVIVGGFGSQYSPPAEDYGYIFRVDDTGYDTTFGITGKAQDPLALAFGYQFAGMQLIDSGQNDDSQDKLILGGFIDPTGSDKDFVVSKLKGDGSLETSFGSGGYTSYANAQGDDSIVAVATQSSSKGDSIIAAGYLTLSGQLTAAVMKLASSGAIDTTFGSQGVLNLSPGEYSRFTDVLVLSDDSIILVGWIGENADQDCLIGKLKPDGGWDTTFGEMGILRQPIVPNGADICVDVSKDIGDNIYLAVEAIPDGETVANFFILGLKSQ